jgi:hypothetical protein
MAGGRRHAADLGSLAEPVLEAMLAQFPFHIRGFHSDNASEFINHTVAEMLNKLLVEQTKSRLRHSNDNGLAESKNGWVIRKHIGYGHFASTHAEAFDEFYRLHFNPYLNFHRPCGVPEVTVTAKGKQKRLSLLCGAVGERARGKPGKPNPGFPSFPTALGNRCAIPTFPPPLRFLCFKTLKTKLKNGDPSGGSLRSRLPAHSSMRKMLEDSLVQTGLRV